MDEKKVCLALYQPIFDIQRSRSTREDVKSDVECIIARNATKQRQRRQHFVVVVVRWWQLHLFTRPSNMGTINDSDAEERF